MNGTRPGARGVVLASSLTRALVGIAVWAAPYALVAATERLAWEPPYLSAMPPTALRMVLWTMLGAGPSAGGVSTIALRLAGPAR
jgi:hypothetical protein